MALTTVKCPECGEVARTAKTVSPGAKVRCSYCKTVFPFRPSANNALDGLPGFEPAEPGSLRECLASGNRMTSDVASDEASGRYRGISNEPIDPDQTITVDRMALKSERSKDRLRGGKPRRFDGPRQVVAVVVIFALMVLGYGLFWWFHGWFNDLGDVERIVQENRKNQAQKPQTPGGEKPATPKVKLPDLNPTPTLSSVRTTAPAPLRIDDLEIEINTARITRIRMKMGGYRNFYLTLSVRVHNRSQQSLEYTGWHCARAMLTMRDAKTKSSYESIKFLPINLPQDCIPQTVIPAGGSIQDLLVFEPPASPYPSLELDLPSPIGYKTYAFSVPADLIELVEGEPAPIAGAPQLPVSETRRPPKGQPTREEQIRAEYLEKWSEVEQIASGKSSSRAAEYKRREKVRIQDELCKKYKVTKQDLKVIVPQ